MNAEQKVRDEASDELIDRLVDGVKCAEESIILSQNNRALETYLRSLTMNQYFVGCNASKRLKIIDKYRFTFELMIGWLIRLYNEKLGVFPCCVLSLWALRCRVPGPFWEVLQKMRLLYCKGYTRGLALDVGKRIESPENFPSWASRKIIAGVGDNCLIKFSCNYEGCKEDGDGSFPYLFINWISLPVPAECVPPEYNPTEGSNSSCFFSFNNQGHIQLVRPGEPLKTGAQPVVQTKQWLLDSHAVVQHKHEAWYMALGKAQAPCTEGRIAACQRVLDRPTDHASVRNRQIYQRHVPTNTGTAAYNDIKSWFSAVLAYLALLNISVILLHGDQQTFSRMLWLKRQDGAGQFKAIVPGLGHFHSAIHMLMAIHKLW